MNEITALCALGVLFFGASATWWEIYWRAHGMAWFSVLCFFVCLMVGSADAANALRSAP